MLTPVHPCGDAGAPMPRTCAAVLLLLAVAGSSAVPAQSRPTVIELFTSQGCSSCPPADAYLGTLRERTEVLALAFHVDYWNSPEWRDPFALAVSTARQDRYVRTLGKSGEYTPQFIIDGRTELRGSRAELDARALAEPKPGVALSLLEADGVLRVDVGSAPGHGGASEVVLVSYRGYASTTVGGGENGGRTLEDFNAVRSLRVLGSWRGEPGHFEVPLASLPADATAVAVLVQVAGQGPILGAASHALGRHTE
jgi:hypothetical protein